VSQKKRKAVRKRPKLTAEVRYRLGSGWRGKKMSDELRAKLVERWTDERKAAHGEKMRAAWRRRRAPEEPAPGGSDEAGVPVELAAMGEPA
jgi:hypothetical protein